MSEFNNENNTNQQPTQTTQPSKKVLNHGNLGLNLFFDG
jgi:hypothetical protein